jgi:hypothetical protein
MNCKIEPYPPYSNASEVLLKIGRKEPKIAAIVRFYILGLLHNDSLCDCTFIENDSACSHNCVESIRVRHSNPRSRQTERQLKTTYYQLLSHLTPGDFACATRQLRFSGSIAT